MNGHHRIHQVSWNNLCYPLEEGSLSVRRFNDISKAFVVKLWWRSRQSSSLWVHFLHAKYCMMIHPTEVQLGSNASRT